MAEWNRNRSIAAGLGALGAACAGFFATRLYRQRKANTDRPAAALTRGRPPGPVGNSGAVRSAGTEEMRDPPRNWDETDQAADESFPASDPVGPKHVD